MLNNKRMYIKHPIIFCFFVRKINGEKQQEINCNIKITFDFAVKDSAIPDEVAPRSNLIFY